MYYIVEYLFSFLYQQKKGDEEEVSKVIDDEPFQMIISSTEIKSVNLKPVSQRVLNIRKYNKIDLRNLNQSQLQEIKDVKLKHIDRKEKQLIDYEPRHPVLKELLLRRR
jgi:hypothetical protein